MSGEPTSEPDEAELPSEEEDGRRIAADAFGRHELLHTASVVMSMFDSHILNHAAVEYGDDEIKDGAQRAFTGLFDFYQLCGSKFLQT